MDWQFDVNNQDALRVNFVHAIGIVLAGRGLRHMYDKRILTVFPSQSDFSKKSGCIFDHDRNVKAHAGDLLSGSRPERVA